MVYHDLDLFKPPDNTPADVFADVAAFFLCQAAQNGNQNLSRCLQGINALLFKNHRDILLLQFSDGGQKIHGISGKAADGFGEYHVNLSRQGILYHHIEI